MAGWWRFPTRSFGLACGGSNIAREPCVNFSDDAHYIRTPVSAFVGPSSSRLRYLRVVIWLYSTFAIVRGSTRARR